MSIFSYTRLIFEVCVFSAGVKVCSEKWSGQVDRSEQLSGERPDPELCNYCKERGHWKAKCPALRAKYKCNGDLRVSLTTLTVSVKTVPGSALSCGQVDAKKSSKAKLSHYLPFVTDSFLSLVWEFC